MGLSGPKTIVRHILPNISSLLIIDATLNVGAAILAETGLSFFGFGVQAPDTSLGTLLGEGARQVNSFPWLFTGPAVVVVLLVLSVNAVGDGLRDALDPNSALRRICPMSVDHHAPAGKVRRTTSGTVLEVRDLHVTFPSEAGPVRAVRGLDFTLAAGETMAIVGESGSGKSVTSLAIMGLHPETAKITGSIKLHGDELLGRSDEAMSRLRGEELAMIFQDPLSALTPVYTIGDQIVETMQVHHVDLPGRRPEPGRRAAGPGRHPQPAGAGEVLPARVLRRHAAAGHDRHGHRQRPRRDHRRRADHRARRDHPGAGAGGAEEGAAGDRRRGDHDHPRPRRGGRHRRSGDGHVRRSSGRAGHAWTRSSTSPADAVHDRPAGRRAPAGRPGQGGAGHAGGEPAVGGQPAARLPVRAALPDVVTEPARTDEPPLAPDRPARAPRPPASTRPGSRRRSWTTPTSSRCRRSPPRRSSAFPATSARPCSSWTT